jgi:hypothetical protein
MSEGELIEDDKGNEKVKIGETESIYFSDYSNGNNGRGHAIKVTYKIVEDGEEKTVTEYYNYILKGSLMMKRSHFPCKD